MVPRTVEVSLRGQTHCVTIGADDDDMHCLCVSVDGIERRVDVRRVSSDILSILELGETRRSHQIRVAETERSGEFDVHVGGAVVRVVVDGHRSGRTEQHDGLSDAGPQSVVAPMPGRVVRVLVAEGDLVAENQGVVVIEAMKMENELRASREGRVVEINTEVGASVEVGKVLIVIA